MYIFVNVMSQIKYFMTNLVQDYSMGLTMSFIIICTASYITEIAKCCT